MATILHLSCDFPDVLVPQKTAAIQRLVDGTPQHRHIVYSLNRISGMAGIDSLEFAKDRFAVAYRAPGKGLLLKTRMEAVAQFVLADARRRGFAFDMVQAHKLTIEGLAAGSIAKSLNLPLAFTIQGDSDLKVIKARPDLHATYASLVACARILFPLAPWTEAAIAERFPSARGKMIRLPVISALDDLTPSQPCGAPHLVTVFHLNSWQRKNLASVAYALAKIASSIPGLRLDVIGGGTPSSFLQAQEVLRTNNAESVVRLLGPVANHDLPAILKRYAAFILPTRRESYGLAHVEALFNGLPVLLSKNMGIDGLLPDAPFAVACDPNSVFEIAAGARKLLQSERAAKQALAEAQRSGQLDHLRRSAILTSYHRGLAGMLEGGSVAAAFAS